MTSLPPGETAGKIGGDQDKLFGLILCCSMFCYGRVFAFAVFDLVFQYQTKRLAEKNGSEMTYFVSGDGT